MTRGEPVAGDFPIKRDISIFAAGVIISMNSRKTTFAALLTVAALLAASCQKENGRAANPEGNIRGPMSISAKAEGIDLRGDKMAMQRLKEAAEKAARESCHLFGNIAVQVVFVQCHESSHELSILECQH